MNIAKVKFKHPLLESYLRGVFKSPKGPIRITERTMLGGFISRLVQTDDVPHENENYDVALQIPDAKCARALHRKFLYYSQADMVSIEKVAMTFYHLDILSSYNSGRLLGLTVKQSIYALLEDYDFEASKLNYEQIRRDLSREIRKKKDMLLASKRQYDYKSLIYANEN